MKAVFENKLALFLFPFLVWGCVGCNSLTPGKVVGLNDNFRLADREQTELQQKALAGDGKAAFRLSEFHRFIRHDSKEELKWLKVSAECGCLQGVYNYAVVLRDSANEGEKVEAVKWFKRAAQRGLPEVQYTLGQIYERGDGVPVDLDAARRWYEQAARVGESSAAERLVEFLSEAKGGPADRVSAYGWAKLLSTRYKGSVFGASVLKTEEKLRASLSPDELTRGEQAFAALQELIPLQTWDRIAELTK
jgi:Sel1 repeat